MPSSSYAVATGALGTGVNCPRAWRAVAHHRAEKRWPSSASLRRACASSAPTTTALRAARWHRWRRAEQRLYHAPTPVRCGWCTRRACGWCSATSSDLTGEVSPPKLRAGETYRIRCSTSQEVPVSDCGAIVGATEAAIAARGASARRGAWPAPVRSSSGSRTAACAACRATFGFVPVLGHRAPAGRRRHAAGGKGSASTASATIRLDAAVAVNAQPEARGAVRRPQHHAGRAVRRRRPPADGARSSLSQPRAPAAARASSGWWPTARTANVRGRNGECRWPTLGSPNGLPGTEPVFLAFRAARHARRPATACTTSLDRRGGRLRRAGPHDPTRISPERLGRSQHRSSPYTTAGNVEVSAECISQMDLNLVRFARATQTAPGQHRLPSSAAAWARSAGRRPRWDGDRCRRPWPTSAWWPAWRWSGPPRRASTAGGRVHPSSSPSGPRRRAAAVGRPRPAAARSTVPGTCAAPPRRLAAQRQVPQPKTHAPSPHSAPGFLAFDTPATTCSRSDPAPAAGRRASQGHPRPNQLVTSRPPRAGASTPTSQ